MPLIHPLLWDIVLCELDPMSKYIYIYMCVYVCVRVYTLKCVRVFRVHTHIYICLLYVSYTYTYPTFSRGESALRVLYCLVHVCMGALDAPIFDCFDVL
jgi:hypothetical protein